MIYENIDKAIELKERIEAMRAEIEEIKILCNPEIKYKSPSSPKKLMDYFTTRQPKKRNNRGLFMSEEVDWLRGRIVVNEREAMAVVREKEKEIEEMLQEIDELE